MTRRLLSRRGAGLLLLALLASGSGCENRMLWAYRDTPYLHDYVEAGEAHCRRRLRSPYVDDRMVALRALAEMSARARRSGDAGRADRLAELILEQYERDLDPRVRNCIIALCAPVSGHGSPPTEAFLRERLAETTWAAPASLSLAALRPEEGYELLAPLAKHPSPIVRYEGALALTVLGDPRGAKDVRRVLGEMTPPTWPYRLHGVALREAREGLATRAERTWGAAASGSLP